MTTNNISTDKKFAEYIGIEHQRIKDINRDSQKVTLDIIQKMKEKFNIDTNMFFLEIEGEFIFKEGNNSTIIQHNVNNGNDMPITVGIDQKDLLNKIVVLEEKLEYAEKLLLEKDRNIQLMQQLLEKKNN